MRVCNNHPTRASECGNWKRVGTCLPSVAWLLLLLLLSLCHAVVVPQQQQQQQHQRILGPELCQYMNSSSSSSSNNNNNNDECNKMNDHFTRAAMNNQRRIVDHISSSRSSSRSDDSSNRRSLQQQPQPAQLNVLVILLQWQDHADRNLIPRDVIERLWNAEDVDETNYNTGSIQQYFLENSYNNLKVQATVLDWQTAPNTEAYYASGRSGLPGNDGRDISDAFKFVLDDLEASDFDFSNFDLDGDLAMDATVIMHSGYVAERGGVDCVTGNGQFDRIQSYARGFDPQIWSSSTTGIFLGPMVMSSVYRGTCNERIARLGVTAHELVHTLGIPDFYDITGYNSGQVIDGVPSNALGGISGYDIMANPGGQSGRQAFPGYMSPYTKYKLGFVQPTEITSEGTYIARPSETTPDIYIISEPYAFGEYLLIENRQPIRWDASLWQPGGILIYHVDETVNRALGLNKDGNYYRGYPGLPGWPGNLQHYQVALLQADGKYEQEKGHNNGHIDDFWREGAALTPGNQEEIASSAGTYPNTDAYSFSTGIIGTGITIDGFSLVEDGVWSFDVSGPLAQGTSNPTVAVTEEPTMLPTGLPTTKSPTEAPTRLPTTESPTEPPTRLPTTESPTEPPTRLPTTESPTEPPTQLPATESPTLSPTEVPVTDVPTPPPTISPTTSTPTLNPTLQETIIATGATTSGPTDSPTSISVTNMPSQIPATTSPSQGPTENPTTSMPSMTPTVSPTALATTEIPTVSPSTDEDATTAPILSTDITDSPTSVPTLEATQRDGDITLPPNIFVNPNNTTIEPTIIDENSITISPSPTPFPGTSTPTSRGTVPPGEGCCSRNYRDCDATYCGSTRDSCRSCAEDRSVLWLTSGARAIDACIPRFMNCTTNRNGCCGGGCFLPSSDSDNRICMSPLDIARTAAPTTTTLTPSSTPSSNYPSATPSVVPSDMPSTVPSSFPSNIPSTSPSNAPSNPPTVLPQTEFPTRAPTTSTPTEVSDSRFNNDDGSQLSTALIAGIVIMAALLALFCCFCCYSVFLYKYRNDDDSDDADDLDSLEKGKRRLLDEDHFQDEPIAAKTDATADANAGAKPDPEDKIKDGKGDDPASHSGSGSESDSDSEESLSVINEASQEDTTDNDDLDIDGKQPNDAFHDEPGGKEALGPMFEASQRGSSDRGSSDDNTYSWGSAELDDMKSVDTTLSDKKSTAAAASVTPEPFGEKFKDDLYDDNDDPYQNYDKKRDGPLDPSERMLMTAGKLKEAKLKEEGVFADPDGDGFVKVEHVVEDEKTANGNEDNPTPMDSIAEGVETNADTAVKPELSSAAAAAAGASASLSAMPKAEADKKVNEQPTNEHSDDDSLGNAVKGLKEKILKEPEFGRRAGTSADPSQPDGDGDSLTKGGKSFDGSLAAPDDDLANEILDGKASMPSKSGTPSTAAPKNDTSKVGEEVKAPTPGFDKQEFIRQRLAESPEDDNPNADTESTNFRSAPMAEKLKKWENLKGKSSTTRGTDEDTPNTPRPTKNQIPGLRNGNSPGDKPAVLTRKALGERADSDHSDTDDPSALLPVIDDANAGVEHTPKKSNKNTIPNPVADSANAASDPSKIKEGDGVEEGKSQDKPQSTSSFGSLGSTVRTEDPFVQQLLDDDWSSGSSSIEDYDFAARKTSK